MKNKKWLLLLIPIALILAIVSFLWGNPVSHILVRTRASSYLNATYPELDLEINSVVYDFKFGGWSVYVSSPTSIDTHFPLRCDGMGTIHYDMYELNVTSGGNTFARHDNAYRDLVKDALSSTASSFSPDSVSALLMTQGSIEYDAIPGENGTEFITNHKDFSLDPSTMMVDQNYDIPPLGAAHGQIVVFLQEETVSVQRLAELLLELRTVLDHAAVPFYAVEFTLSSTDWSESISVCDFLYSDIYEDGLTERVQNACDAYEDYIRQLPQ